MPDQFLREYERTCTTATNAYVKPITSKHLKKLKARLQAWGFDGKLFIMLSSGGITSIETATEFPVRIIESGPTAADIRKLFDKEYKRLYGRSYPETRVEFVTFKVRASLAERPFKLPQLGTTAKTIEDCLQGERLAFSVISKEFIVFTVYDRQKLFSGARFAEPAIIEERESTIVVGEDAEVSINQHGFVCIDIRRSS